MKKLILITITMMIVSPMLFSQSACLFASIADSLFKEKRNLSALSYYKKAIKNNCLNSKWDLYNAAAAAALCGKKQMSIRYLQLLKNKNWAKTDYIKSDTAFLKLMHSKKWKKFITSLNDTVLYYQPIKKVLFDVYNDDQLVRRDIDSLYKKYTILKGRDRAYTYHYIDSINLVKVLTIIDKFGWISYDIIGYNANNSIFLTIQHSDIATMEKYCPLLRQSVLKENSQPIHLALMEDRILMDRTGKQKYGTQFTYDDTGNKVMLPIDDIENVDQRRTMLKLPTLASDMQKNKIKF